MINRKKTLTALLGLVALTACGGNHNKVITKAVDKEKNSKVRAVKSIQVHDTLPTALDKFTKDDSLRICQLLKEGLAKKKSLTHQQLILFIARKFIGVPYIAHTLDRNDDERLVVNLHGLDCTTYVEVVLALVSCIEHGQSTFSDYVHTLQKIRYRGGHLSYENRLHYFHWWLEDNQSLGFVKEIVSSNEPFSGLQKLKINYMSTHASAYDMLKQHPERVEKIRSLENESNGTEVRYIPKSKLLSADLKTIIKDGDIIAIVTKKPNLDTTHLGLAVWYKDGLHLMNASSLKRNGNKVIEPSETLYQYLQGQPSSIGIRVARIL